MRVTLNPEKFALTEHHIINARPCYYCGDIATTTDHVPPRNTRKMYDNSTMDIKKPQYFEVDACRECNCALNDQFDTLKARKEYIWRWLKRRYRKLANMPDWTEEELAAVAPNMQRMVRANLRKRAVIIERITWARDHTVQIRTSEQSQSQS